MDTYVISEMLSATMRVPVPTPSPLTMRYYRMTNVLRVIKTVWPIILLLLVLFTGLSAQLRDWTARVSTNWYIAILAYFALFTGLMFAVSLPLEYYSRFVVPHAYGLSVQPFERWVRYEGINLGLTLLLGSVTLWIPYTLIRRAPKRWWLYVWYASIPLILFTMFVWPIWISPLFNHFELLRDEPLATQISTLAHRAGIDNVQIYVVNKSVDTRMLNAYVTGIGNVKRIVLWDTIIKQLSTRELLVVIGHEMGHYVMNHVWKSAVGAIALLFIGLWISKELANVVVRRHRVRLGFSHLADVASLPLFLLLFHALVLVGTPLVLSYLRHDEYMADQFGLELTHDNEACGTLFVKLSQHNLTPPYPGLLWKLWFSTHPAEGDRINFCNNYHPWFIKNPGLGR